MRTSSSLTVFFPTAASDTIHQTSLIRCRLNEEKKTGTKKNVYQLSQGLTIEFKFITFKVPALGVFSAMTHRELTTFLRRSDFDDSRIIYVPTIKRSQKYIILKLMYEHELLDIVACVGL